MKLDSEDIIFAIAALFAALGLFYPWCLVLAFFILLIPLRQNVKKRKLNESDGNVSNKTSTHPINSGSNSKVINLRYV